jgi:hypothetical protein
MATCDTRGDDDDNPFAMARAEGSTPIVDVTTARQLNPRRRQSTAHTESSATGWAPAKDEPLNDEHSNHVVRLPR